MAGSRIKGITVEIGGDTTGLDKALKSVNSTIKSTQSQLKDINKLLKLDPTNTELLSQKQAVLKEKIGATKEKLDALKTAQEQAKQQLESGDLGKEKYDALQREIIETEQELKNLIREAAEANATLNKIDAVGKKFEEVGGKITNVGKGLTTRVTLPLTAVGIAGVKSFADVDKTMQLTNKTMGNTEEQAEMLNKAMKDAAANSTFGMNDAATATLNFARAGLNAEQAAAALAPSMNLAAGEGGNLDTVSAGLVATINGFHGSFEDAGKYADVFAAACNNSALDVDSLSSAMSVAAPIFSAAGYSVNDAALYMGVMANNGIDADKAANSLKTGLARLVSPAKEGAEKMAELGISVTNADGTMKDSVTIQRELHEAFGKLSESEQIAAASAIFGKNQMAPWLALINTAPGDVDALNDSLENCAGTTEEMAQAMMSGFGGSLEKLKSSIDVLLTSLGEALAPTIQKIADVVQKLVDKFNALTPAQQQTIAKIGLVVAAIGPALVVFGKLTTGIGQSLQAFSSIGKGVLTFVGNAKAGIGVAGSLAKGMSALWSVLMANPIILIIAAIAAAVAALIYAYNHSEKFRNFVNKLWEGIKTAFEGIKTAIQTAMNFIVELFQAVSQTISEIWEGIKSIVTGAINAIKTTVETVWNAIVTFFTTILEGIKTAFTTAWNAIKTTVTTVVNAISTTIQTVWNGIKTFFTTIFNAIKQIFTTVWNAIKTTVTTVVNAIKTTVTTVWNAIKTTVTTIVNAIKTTVTIVWNGIKTAVTTVVNAIKNTVTTVWNGIKNTISTVVNGIKNIVSNVFNGVKNTASNIFNGIKNTATNVWNAIKNAITAPIEAAKNTVKNVIDRIKGFFNFSWSLPKLKLPHLSITGHFSIAPPSVPHFSIDWYKEGGIMTKPTMFGLNGSSLVAGGEAGAEAILPLKGFYDKLESILSNGLNTAVMERYLEVIAANSAKDIFLDSGVLVGELAPGVNRKLGNQRFKAERGMV